jgi:hypothetical protein
MARFGDASLSGKNFVSDALAVFQDRASLRVTDVSSVVYRDFALWYAYYFLADTNLPEPIPARMIRIVFDAMANRDDVLFEQALHDLLDVESWSALL